MSRLCAISCIALCLLAPALSTAEPLTLGEVVRRALERGFDMELQGYDLSISKDSVIGAKSAFDPQLSARLGKSVSRTAAEELLPGSSSTGMDSSVGLSQRLSTGTSIGLGANLNRSEINPAFAVLNPAYSSGLTLAVRQPLLRGFGTRINTAGVRSAEIGLDNAERSYRGRALDVIRSAETAYYQLAGTREQLGVVRSSLDLADRLLGEAQSRHRAGMATKLDVLQAQVGASTARSSVLQAENAVKAAEDVLLALTGRFELDDAPGAVTLTENMPDALPTVDETYQRALQNEPGLLNARASLELARIDLALAQDGLKPSLDLDLAVGFNGDDADARGAFDGTFAADHSSWQAGLSMSYPIGRAGEKARYRQSKASFRREELGLQRQEQGVLVDVRNAVRDVETSARSVKLATETVELSRKQLEFENARFRAGLSTSRLVLEAQNSLESARVALVQAKLNLQGSLAGVRRIEGSSLEHYGIELGAP